MMLQKFSAKLTELIYSSDKQQNHSANKLVALAVSGGADSLCMTLMVSQIMRDIAITPIALIVDHKLRHESTEEATWVQQYITQCFGIKSVILTWYNNNVNNKTSNIQHKARSARYSLMLEYCKSNSMGYLCVAHNKNDQAETVLMRILRGSGIDGISGIRETCNAGTAYDNDKVVKIIRPMLLFPKHDVYKYMTEHSIQWVEDRSNSNMHYERVKVRELLSHLHNVDFAVGGADMIISRLCLLASNARRSSDFITKYTKKRMGEICVFTQLGAILVDAKDLIEEDEEISLRILRQLIIQCGGDNYAVRFDCLKRLHNLLHSCYTTHKFFTSTLGDCLIWLCQKRDHTKRWILVITKESKDFDNKSIKVQDDSILWDDRFLIEKSYLCNCDMSISAMGERWLGIKKCFLQQNLCTMRVVNSSLYKDAMEIVTTIPNSNYIMKTNPLVCCRCNGMESFTCPSIGIIIDRL